MARKLHKRTNLERLTEISDYIKQNGPVLTSHIAKHFQLNCKIIIHTLVIMEEQGILLIEDDHGRISVFGD